MTKSFSEGFKVSRKDIIEFNQWIKSGNITPRLRSYFKSDSEYEDYMTEYQESHKDKIFSGVSEGAAVVGSGMSYGKDHEEFSDREKVSAEMLEKAKSDGVVQEKPNGSWGIISIDAGEWWNADYDSKESAEDALKAYHANKSKTFSTPKYYLTIQTQMQEYGSDLYDAESEFLDSIGLFPRLGTRSGMFDYVLFDDAESMNKKFKELSKAGGKYSKSTITNQGGQGGIHYFEIDNHRGGLLRLYIGLPNKFYENQFSQKSFSNNVWKSYDGKHEFTIDELKDMQKLLNSNKDTFDLIMLWMNSKVTADDLLNKRIPGNAKPGIEWAIESQTRNDRLEEIKQKVSEELSGVLSKLGLKFDAIYPVRYGKKSIEFYISFKDNKSLNKAVEFLTTNLETYEGDSLLNLRRRDQKSGIDFKSWEDSEEFIIYARIDRLRLKSNNLLKKYFKEDSGSFFSNVVNKIMYNKDNKSFSLIPLKNGSFDPMPTEMLPNGIPGVPDLIGSLMFSVTYAHLFHICTAEYPAHIALQEYYEAMPDLVDALAEAAIGNNDTLEFRCIVYPNESESAVDYFTSLLGLVLKVQEITSQADQIYQPQVDAIKEQVESTLYKLKRLSGGQKVFSEVK